MGRSSLRQVLVGTEGSFAGTAGNPGGNTYARSLPVLGRPTLTLPQDRIEDTALLHRAHDSRPGLKGPREMARFEFETYWPGHILPTTGALTAHWAYELMRDALGGGNAGDEGTTVDDDSATTTGFDVADATFSPGSILRVASGEAARVRAISGDALALHTTLGAAPADTSIVHATLQAFPVQAAAVATKRFLHLHEDTGAQHHLLGSQLEEMTFTIETGRPGRLRWAFGCGYWERGAVSFPVAEALADDLPGPWASGPIQVATFHATAAARTLIVPARIELTLQIENTWHRTHGGLVPDQVFTQVTRRRVIPRVTFTLLEWSTAYETLWDLDGSGTEYKQVLVQNCGVDGKVSGFYMPYAFIVGERPRPEDVDENVGISFTLQGREWAAGTNDLSKAPIVFFFG